LTTYAHDETKRERGRRSQLPPPEQKLSFFPLLRSFPFSFIFTTSLLLFLFYRLSHLPLINPSTRLYRGGHNLPAPSSSRPPLSAPTPISSRPQQDPLHFLISACCILYPSLRIHPLRILRVFRILHLLLPCATNCASISSGASSEPRGFALTFHCCSNSRRVANPTFSLLLTTSLFLASCVSAHEHRLPRRLDTAIAPPLASYPARILSLPCRANSCVYLRPLSR
jgi:hypothetical protein